MNHRLGAREYAFEYPSAVVRARHGDLGYSPNSLYGHMGWYENPRRHSRALEPPCTLEEGRPGQRDWVELGENRDGWLRAVIGPRIGRQGRAERISSVDVPP